MIRGDGPVFSAGYDIGNLDEGRFEENAEKLVAHPFQDAIEAIDAYRYPVVGRSTATRSAAAWSWRSPATCGSRRAASSSGCRPRSSA